MGYDAMANDASYPAPAAVPRDLAKKKRGNRSAKLKQCKLDARREQWLSQVKHAKNGMVTTASPPAPHPPLPRRTKGCSEARQRGEGEDRDDSGLLQELSDFDSPIHSPSSNGSRNNASRKGFPNSSSGSSAWSSSRSVSDAEEDEAEGREEENGVLDDWEAVADALSINSNDIGHNSGPTGPPVEPVASPGLKQVVSMDARAKTEPIRCNSRAWKPDDTFRPQSLPSVSKQASFPASMERRWAGTTQKGILSLPSSCPICYEDLDPTDSSFLPCPCGFHLCLFCHKRILEDDGRCPGCRKQYDAVPSAGMDASAVAASVLPLRLSRSCSMGSRY